MSYRSAGLRAALLAGLAVVALSLSGCGAPTPFGGGTTISGDDSISSENPFLGNGNRTYFTVMVDGQTWELWGFGCTGEWDDGHGNSYSMGGSGSASIDDEGYRFLINASDPSGQTRISGDGVVYDIEMTNTGYDSEPSVDVKVTGATDGVTVSGKTFTISGQFADQNGKMRTIETEVTCPSP